MFFFLITVSLVINWNLWYNPSKLFTDLLRKGHICIKQVVYTKAFMYVKDLTGYKCNWEKKLVLQQTTNSSPKSVSNCNSYVAGSSQHTTKLRFDTQGENV